MPHIIGATYTISVDKTSATTAFSASCWKQVALHELTTGHVITVRRRDFGPSSARSRYRQCQHDVCGNVSIRGRTIQPNPSEVFLDNPKDFLPAADNLNGQRSTGFSERGRDLVGIGLEFSPSFLTTKYLPRMQYMTAQCSPHRQWLRVYEALR